MWFGIWILSLVLSAILLPIGFVFGLIQNIYRNKFIKEGLPNLNQKFKRLATGIDIFGNVVCSELFNTTLISKNAKTKFGQHGQTISAVIGYNKLDGTLTRYGRLLDKILDAIDENHTIKATK